MQKGKYTNEYNWFSYNTVWVESQLAEAKLGITLLLGHQRRHIFRYIEGETPRRLNIST
jgi:hypothetical protein